MSNFIAKLVTPLCVVLVAIAAAHADSDSKKCQADCKSKDCQVASKDCQQCESSCSDCKGCPIAKAMEALPKLVYKIGDETTTSPIQAGRIATKTKHKIEFVVADKVFADEPKAFAALVDTTEEFVNTFATPHKCESTGSTLVAGKSLCCDEAAGEVVSLVKKAMDEVKVTYRVGDQSVCCPDEAKSLAKESGEKVVQLIAGQKCGGGCGSTTRLSIAHAKYKAAIQALLAADTKTPKNSESTSTDKQNGEVSAS